MGVAQNEIYQFSAPKQQVDFRRANAKHPDAKAFLLAQVEPEVDVIVKMAGDVFGNEMYVIDVTDDIPKHFPQIVKKQIEDFLKKNEFDERDNDVCIISPFIDLFRGFIVEIYDREKAEKMIQSLIDKGFEGKILGMIFKDLSKPNRTYHIDPKLDAHDRRQKRLNEEAYNAAINKAKVINRLW